MLMTPTTDTLTLQAKLFRGLADELLVEVARGISTCACYTTPAPREQGQ